METVRCVRQSSSRAHSVAGRSEDMSLGGESLYDMEDLESCVSDRGYHGDTDSITGYVNLLISYNIKRVKCSIFHDE